MSYYALHDSALRPYYVQEPPMEPPDCWSDELPGPDAPEYDRAEDEISGIFNRRVAHGSKNTR